MFIRAYFPPFSSHMPFIKTRFAGIDCRPVRVLGAVSLIPVKSASSLVLVGAHLNFTQVIGDLMKFFPPLQLHNPQSQLMKPRSEKSFACEGCLAPLHLTKMDLISSISRKNQNNYQDVSAFKNN